MAISVGVVFLISQLLAVVTLHDACPAFYSRIFEITGHLEELEIRYNIGLVHFFNGEQDLSRFPPVLIIFEGTMNVYL